MLGIGQPPHTCLRAGASHRGFARHYAFRSLSPEYRDERIGGTLPAVLPYLPDLLQARGYRTAAFVGSIQLDPRNGMAQGSDRGFQTYDAGFRPAIVGAGASPVYAEHSGSQVAARATA